jgi:hypothetical protein
MTQTDRNSRWITVRAPFNFYWSHRAVTHFSDADLGEHLVKNELADFAVEKGYASEGKLDGSAKSRKGKTRRAAKPREAKPAATTADTGTVPTVGDASAPDADRAAGGSPVDSDAG